MIYNDIRARVFVTKKENLFSPVGRARVGVVYYRAKFGCLSPLFFVFFVFTRERKGKEYNAETSVPFFPTKLNMLLPFLIP
jgi:hypothetical protein